MNSRIDFEELCSRLVRTSSRATISRLGFAHNGLRGWVGDQLGSSAGSASSLLADPVFEATFGWKGSGKTWGELSPELLRESLIEAITSSGNHQIDRDWVVFDHQLKAFETLLGEQTQSTIISSGTGSGKTECFLIPVLESLARQLEEKPDPIEGVQALFLYPLNALINSQQERLSAWTSPFNGKIRYCLYNGDTPESIREPGGEQVLSRKELRASPPPILFTNPSMLEYMLVRREDSPILERSKGKLKWIVLDEAHTYIGSQAAELALLLRRVMIAFGVSSENVRFVATSATIGDGESESIEKLKKFLADVAGVHSDQVVFISGQRHIPAQSPLVDNKGSGNVDTAATLYEQLSGFNNSVESSQSDEDKSIADYQLVSQSTTAQSIRTAVAERPQPASALANLLGGDTSSQQVTQLMSRISSVVSDDGVPFLPQRMHVFHKTMPGLWVCINPACTTSAPEPSDSVWPWGSAFTKEIDACEHCGSLTLELVYCNSCGVEYLKCDELYESDTGKVRMVNRLPDSQIDEFRLNVSDSWDGDEDDDEVSSTDVEDEKSSIDDGRYPKYLARLVADAAAHNTVELSLDGEVQSETGSRYLLSPVGKEFECACCGLAQTERRPEWQLFRSARMGMPFYSTPVVQSLLNETPSAFREPNKAASRLPMQGRRVITFTDSRQGTARLSIAQQLDADRNFIRSHVYHQLLQMDKGDSQAADMKRLKDEVAALEENKDNPVIAGLWQEKVDQLNTLTEANSSPSIRWGSLINSLSQIDDLSKWSLPLWRGITFLSNVESAEYANYCLYRELMRRPKRATTIETLGLIGIRYAELEAIQSVPKDVSARGISLEEWRTLLTLAITFTFRANVSLDLDDSWLRWMGVPVHRTVMRGPAQERMKGATHWPSAEYPRGTLINLIRRGLNLDLSNAEDKQWLAYVLGELWQTLRNKLGDSIRDMGDGYHLHLSESSELYMPTEVWHCQYTKLAFDRLFRGISPYGPTYELGEDKDTALCKLLTVPRVPYAYWKDSDGSALDPQDWLETNEQVRSLREKFLWNNRSDQITSVSPWMAVGEHSAQQSSTKLGSLESNFKEGRVNILNCSTTMEMGVDIGGISAVMMNNAPPAPSNYLQRAGRAGRRGETAAVALTLCGNNAHGALIFNNPTWPFTTPIAVPRVILSSEDIIQRHVNAFLLSAFIKSGEIADQMRAKSGWFFGLNTNSEDVWTIPSPCDEFRAWLSNTPNIIREHEASLKLLLNRTQLEGTNLRTVILGTEKSISNVQARWIEEVKATLREIQYLSSQLQANEKSPAIRSSQYQLNRTTGEYLLRDLATKTFLPGYGFPTNVVSFVNTTIDDLKAKDKNQSREENRLMSRGYPSRDLSVALREYAPGADIALDGRVYRSGGLTLNWHIPAGDSSTKEEQALSNHWYCKECGAGDVVTGPRPEACSVCGNVDLKTERVIEPAGFAVDITYKPHNDLSLTRYIPVNHPRLYINDSVWVNLPHSKVGRFRYTVSGSVLHRSAGRSDAGYSLCLMCGRAEEQAIPGEVAAVFNGKAHKRLRGGKEQNGSSECLTSEHEYAIQRDLRLAHQSTTSIFELQLNETLSDGGLSEDSVAWTLAFALKRGLLLSLGLESTEIDVSVQEARSRSGKKVQSIFLFDTLSGGAGYVEYMINNLIEVFGHAKQLLECPSNCTTACHSCLLTYETQHSSDKLDRQAALAFINNGFFDSLRLPSEVQYFGSASFYEPHDLIQAVSMAITAQSGGVGYLMLGGEAEHWNLAEFELLDQLRGWANNGRKVCLVVPSELISNIPDSDKRLMSDLSTYPNVEIKESGIGFTLTADSEVRAAVIYSNGESVTWATDNASVEAPGNGWGENSNVLVRGEVDLSKFVQQLMTLELTPDMPAIRQGSQRLEIRTEFDGAVGDFGSKFWDRIEADVPELLALFKAKGPASEITYKDKYLKSPLTLRLLLEFLRARPEYLSDSSTSLYISSISLEKTNRVDTAPQMMYQNWQKDDVRRHVFLASVRNWWQGESDFRVYSNLHHYRELRVMWPDGTSWKMQFDQGFGAWNCERNERHRFDLSAQLQSLSMSEDYIYRIHNRDPNRDSYFVVDMSVS